VPSYRVTRGILKFQRYNRAMDGILLVDKPAGWTSHDVVAKIRGIIKHETGQKLKIGHTGTLDPMATGLLILVLGKYTKRAAEFSKLDKTYEAELTLGATSTTGDTEGEIIQKSTQKPTKEAVEAALSTFLGEISQIPPQYSAIKIGGQRAYKAARAGKTVIIEPRKVKIYEITDVKYDYPKLSFTTSVSSGTYIRSLAADIGEKLGTGAYLSGLRRTQIGELKLAQSVSLDKIKAVSVNKYIRI
jgi:tRNA pseudouridine55 synthase